MFTLKLRISILDKHSIVLTSQLSSLFLGMQVLVDARDKLEIPWEHPNTYLAANQAILFHSNNDLDVDTFRTYAAAIHCLWQDRAIKKAYERRREFQLVSCLFGQWRCTTDEFSFCRVTPSATSSKILTEYRG